MLNKTHDQKSGLFWFVAGIIIIYFSIRYGIGNLGEPGPGYVSFLMGIIITVLSGVMIMRDGRGKIRQPISSLFQGNWFRVALTMGILLLYTILLSYLGFMLDTMILIYTLMFVAGRRNHVITGITAIAVSLLSYFVFSVLLQVNLPVGIPGDILRGEF